MTAVGSSLPGIVPLAWRTLWEDVYIGHGRNKGAHGGMGRSSSPREEVLFLFSFTSLVFHTCSALETQSERKSVDAPFGSFTSLD